MSTTSRQQQRNHHHHHHHRSSVRSQTLHKLGSIISPLSSNLHINLIEPILYFRGNTEESVGCFLRGNLELNLSKPTKIRKIEMKFIGRMKTFWPEGKLNYGSSSNRNELCEEREIMTHDWTFLSSFTPSSETLSSSNSNSNSNRFRILRRSSGSLIKSHLISAGVHKFPFELFIPGNIPETIETERGTVRYKLSATAVRFGLLPNLHVSQNVTIIRTFPEERNSEGIAIANEWKKQLGYEITIPKKAYPIGGESIEIDLKLTPKEKKTEINEIKIQIEEESFYKTNGQKYVDSRIISTHKVNDFVISNNEDKEHLEDLFYHQNISIPLPKCTSPIRFSYKSSSINISHRLKFIFTIKSPLTNSDNDEIDRKKRKRVDIRVDVPFTILSCRCADGLPQYEDENHNFHQSNDENSPSYEFPPSYEQSMDNDLDSLRRQTNLTLNSFNNEVRYNSANNLTTITSQTTELRPPLERLLTF